MITTKTTLLMIIGCIAVSTVAVDIKLKDGQEFKGARVVSVTPVGVDIAYKDKDGPVVRSLPFSLMSKEMQKKYNYKPDESKNFTEKANKAAEKQWSHLLKTQVDKACKRKAELAQKVHKLNREHDRKVAALRKQHQKAGYSKDELTNMIFAHRRSVDLNVTRRIKKAAYGEIVARDEKKPKENILVIGADGDPDRVWRGVIYPAGIKTDVENYKALSVYCTSLKRAVSLLQHHLNRYSSIAVDRAMDGHREHMDEARDKAEDNEEQAETDEVEDGMAENYNGWNYWYGGNTYIYPSPRHHYRPRHPRPLHHERRVYREKAMGGHRR